MGSDRPNILFLFTDQQRLDTLGCYGNSVCRTPNIDALASQGVRFDQAYTCTAICTPARGSLLTGMMPHKHSLLANFERNVGYRTELPDETIPFSRYLAEAGYRVGTVGKWHIGVERGPEYYGFDGIHYPGWGQPVDHEDYRAYLEERSLPEFSVRDVVRAKTPNPEVSIPIAGVYEGPPEASFPYFLAERTIQKLEAYAGEGNDDRPFFLACQWFGPHLPYFIPQAYYDMYDPGEVELPGAMDDAFLGKPRVHAHYARHWGADHFTQEEWRRLVAVYWGYVSLIDEQVGRIIAAMERLGLRDRTAVFYSTDHGAFVGNHRMQDKGPAMYDDIYRIPLIASVPGGLKGATDAHFVSLADLTATFLDLAGVRTPDHYDGRTVVPLLRGDEPADWRTHVTAEFHGHHFPYPQRMIRTRTHKLVVNPADVNELYDLVQDPDELVNQIDNPAYAGARDRLVSLLYDELKAAGDNFYHWMTTACRTAERVEDPSMGPLSASKNRE